MIYQLKMKNDRVYLVYEKSSLYILNDVLTDINKQLEPYGFFVDRGGRDLPLEIIVHSVVIKNNKYNFLIWEIKENTEYNLVLLDENSHIITALKFNITYDFCECYFNVKEVDISSCDIEIDNKQINDIKSKIDELSKELNILENLSKLLS